MKTTITELTEAEPILQIEPQSKPTVPANAEPEKAEPPKAEPPKPTEAELEKRRKEVRVAMGWEKPEPVETPPPKLEPTAAEPPAAEPQPKPEAELKEKPAPKPKRETTAEVISRTAKAVGEEMSRILTDKPEAEPVAEAEPEFTPEDLRDLAIIQRMEANNPSLKGQAEEFKKFSLARYDYQSDWESKNPGQTFDPSSAEHEDFYKRQPQIDPDLYEDAKIDLKVDAIVAERLKSDPEIKALRNDTEEQRRTKAYQAAAPKIAEQVVGKIHQLVTAVDPDLAKLLTDEGGKINLSKEKVDEMKASNPIAARVLEPLVMGELGPMLQELEKTAEPALEYKLDPGRNKVHAAIANYIDHYEATMAKAPEDVRIRDGKEFSTIGARNEFVAKVNSQKLSEAAKVEKVKAFDAKHWTASIDDIEEVMIDHISARAKQEISEWDGVARKKYDRNGDGAKPKSASEPVLHPAPNPTPTPLSKRPSITPASAVVDTTRPAASGAKSFGEIAVATHWHK